MSTKRTPRPPLATAARPQPGEYAVVRLRRLAASKGARLAALMDKLDEGTLTALEQRELKRLGAEVDALLLANSKALARTIRPELFDTGGRPVGPRLRRSLQAGSAARANKRDAARA